MGREIDHREFTYSELEELEADLGKLRRWTDQVIARDYFDTGPPLQLSDILDRCEAALTGFVESAAAAGEYGAQ